VSLSVIKLKDASTADGLMLFEDGTDEPLEDDGDASAAKIQVTYLAAYATPSADNTRLIT